MIRISVALCLLLAAPEPARSQETFGQVNFINASPHSALQLTIGGDTLGSDIGLRPGDFDGPYEFIARPYTIELIDAESGDVLAKTSIDLGDESELVFIAHPSPPEEETDNGDLDLLVLSRDELFEADEEPGLLFISFLSDAEASFTFGGETRSWPFGEQIRIEGWPLEEIEAKDPEGEWGAFLEWSSDRAEFERYQVLAIFPGPDEIPLLTRHVFFFDEAG
ncbi:MAG: hypothetical protein AAF491_09285 [Verrucomicrobiota bacterium]